MFYPKVGTPCAVEYERWRWVACYTDGSCLRQFEVPQYVYGTSGPSTFSACDWTPYVQGRYEYHRFDEIDQGRLSVFVMESDHGRFSVAWMPEYKLIHFYRTVVLEAATYRERRARLYCFGFQCGGVKVINVIMPDNTVCIVDNVDKVRMS